MTTLKDIVKTSVVNAIKKQVPDTYREHMSDAVYDKVWVKALTPITRAITFPIYDNVWLKSKEIIDKHIVEGALCGHTLYY